MSAYGERPYAAFAVGDRATFDKTIGEAEIAAFAELSGDRYPLHVDEEYARSTRFGRRAVHGMLSASLISTVCGLVLQRPGGILVSQTLRYRRPVFAGDTLTAVAEVVELLPRHRRLRCTTTVRNQRAEIVVDGEAVLQKDPA